MKVAYFEGDCRSYFLGHGKSVTMDEIMREAQTGELPRALADSDAPRFGWERESLTLVLVPDDFDLTTLNGDDWDDAPADCNASRPYGARVGDEWVDLDLIPGVLVLDLRIGDRVSGDPKEAR